MAEKKQSFLSRFLTGRRRSRTTVLTPDDIRRKLEGYQKTEGPAEFGTARLYAVQEADEVVVADLVNPLGKGVRKSGP